MRRGDWRQNGEAIKFDANGQLRDGQHRLMAIVESGVTLDLLVVEGLPAEAQETMDMGVRRTMADLLRIRGDKNTHLLAATLAALFRLRANTLGSQVPGDHPTHQELLQLLDAEPEIRRFVQHGRSVTERVGVSSSLAAALWYEFARADADDAMRFFNSLKSGENLEEGDAIFALRRLLERDKFSKRARTRYETAGLIVKAWGHWRRGTRIAFIVFRPGGARKEPFPAIDGLPVSGTDEAYEKPLPLPSQDGRLAKVNGAPPRAETRRRRRARGQQRLTKVTNA